MTSRFVDSVCLKVVCDTVLHLGEVQPEKRGFSKDEIVLACQNRFPNMGFSMESYLRHIRHAVRHGFLRQERLGKIAFYYYNWSGGFLYWKGNGGGD